jgi:hypothetical protein
MFPPSLALEPYLAVSVLVKPQADRKNYVDNAINTPQYLELVILLAQNVGSDL